MTNHSGDIGGNSGEAQDTLNLMANGQSALLPAEAAVNLNLGGSPLDRDDFIQHDDYSDRSLKHNLITMNRGGGYLGNRNSDLDRQTSLLKSCECIKESEVRELCNMARDILLEESNI